VNEKIGKGEDKTKEQEECEQQKPEHTEVKNNKDKENDGRKEEKDSGEEVKERDNDTITKEDVLSMTVAQLNNELKKRGIEAIGERGAFPCAFCFSSEELEVPRIDEGHALR
jgi:hypothetical protein